LFPEGFHDEVQIQATVLASDRTLAADFIAMNAASAALSITDLPFQGPIGSVRLGYIDGLFIPFPTQEQLELSDLDLMVSGSKDAVTMIEGFARELPEDLMYEAIMTAHGFIRQVLELEEELIAKVKPERPVFTPPPEDPLCAILREKYYDAFTTAKQTAGKLARAEAVETLRAEVKKKLEAGNEKLIAKSKEPIDLTGFDKAWSGLEYRIVRDLILSGHRPDGRDRTTVRDISCRVDVLPCVHGSALFTRGETQALVTVTLGTTKDEQKIDGLVEEYSKKFMLDYNFPPYSVGECRPIRGPGRREIGHGMLAERSVNPVLPGPDDFPYTIRIISDILESNGSSSMATVCGATLGLMSAGVPILNPVAGISIGLVKESDDQWVTITDIIGDEDHFGDMDFKVAGTQNGITGIQLDLKINGITPAIVKQTLTQARKARFQILRKMLTAISRPRAEISPNAPRLLQTHIPQDKIGLLIGPGGKTIRAMQEETGASIEISEDGTVTIASGSLEGANAALEQVEALTATVEIGRIYNGKVSSIKDFGVFVEIIPGRDGLCHVSELSSDYVQNVADFCKVGDRLKVKVLSIDEQDRVKLSHKVVMLEERAAGGETSAPVEESNQSERRERRERNDERRNDERRNGGGERRERRERRRD
ncbi:MAG: polyribonucleotide nucleotidyltransferase, partial [Planctomycetia bacterium]|nr:polyribonucleotide nucleotidyltransferase [Planctomycetia bacterium]